MSLRELMKKEKVQRATRLLGGPSGTAPPSTGGEGRSQYDASRPDVTLPLSASSSRSDTNDTHRTQRSPLTVPPSPCTAIATPSSLPSDFFDEETKDEGGGPLPSSSLKEGKDNGEASNDNRLTEAKTRVDSRHYGDDIRDEETKLNKENNKEVRANDGDDDRGHLTGEDKTTSVSVDKVILGQAAPLLQAMFDLEEEDGVKFDEEFVIEEVDEELLKPIVRGGDVSIPTELKEQKTERFKLLPRKSPPKAAGEETDNLTTTALESQLAYEIELITAAKEKRERVLTEVAKRSTSEGVVSRAFGEPLTLSRAFGEPLTLSRAFGEPLTLSRATHTDNETTTTLPLKFFDDPDKDAEARGLEGPAALRAREAAVALRRQQLLAAREERKERELRDLEDAELKEEDREAEVEAERTLQGKLIKLHATRRVINERYGEDITHTGGEEPHPTRITHLKQETVAVKIEPRDELTVHQGAEQGDKGVKMEVMHKWKRGEGDDNKHIFETENIVTKTKQRRVTHPPNTLSWGSEGNEQVVLDGDDVTIDWRAKKM